MTVTAKDYWIWQKPEFGKWNSVSLSVQGLSEEVVAKLAGIKFVANELSGRDGLNFESELLFEESIKTSEIEGKSLDRESVRSAILKKLGSEGVDPSIDTREVEGLIESLHDSVVNRSDPLTHERLHRWQASLFPNGRDERGYPVQCGAYRKDAMRIITQTGNKPEVLHYVAPPPEDVPALLEDFLAWFNNTSDKPSLIRAAIAVFWFVSIHPYEDGNGRLCRLIGDLAIAQALELDKRIYSFSHALTKSKKLYDDYYSILEQCQRCELNIEVWISFFLKCALSAGGHALSVTKRCNALSLFFLQANRIGVNERQQLFLKKFLNDNEPFAKCVTAKKYKQVTRSSVDSTNKRDIADLVKKGILVQIPGTKGRNVAYTVCKEPDSKNTSEN